MAYTPRGIDKQAYLVYVTESVLHKIDAVAEKHYNENRSAFLQDAVDSYLHLYHLPEILSERIIHDCGERDMDEYLRDYFARAAMKMPEPLETEHEQELLSKKTPVKWYGPLTLYAKVKALADEKFEGNIHHGLLEATTRVLTYYNQPPVLVSRLRAAAAEKGMGPVRHIHDLLSRLAITLPEPPPQPEPVRSPKSDKNRKK